MITIKKNGKFIIPEDEVFIGHAGDNLNATKEFFVEGVADESLVYRMYLQFDDGSTNFFLLDSETADGGTKLVWSVTNDQIYKSGILKMQIKASNSSGVVFHSAVTSMVVLTALEFAEAYKNKDNSEYLQHEEFLNELTRQERSALAEAKEIFAMITDGSYMDDEPTVNSSKAVKSGGIYNALLTKLNDSNGSVKASNLSQEVKNMISSAVVKVGTGAPITLEDFDSYELKSDKLYYVLLTTNQLFLGSETQYCYIFKPSDRREIIISEIDGLFLRGYVDLKWNTPYRVYYTIEKINQFNESFSERISEVENTVGTLNDYLENILGGGVE